MLFYWLIISPLCLFLFKKFPLTLEFTYYYIITLYFFYLFLRWLDRKKFFEKNTISLLKSRFLQYIIYYALLLEDYIISNPIRGYFIFLLFNYFILSFLFISPNLDNLFYWIFLFLYWLTTSYFRLRFLYLNEYKLSIYNGKPSFLWTDVLRAVSHFMGQNIPNRISSSQNHSFQNIQPKRGMRKAGEKIIENPELQKAAIAGATAIAAAGVVQASGVLAKTGEKIQLMVGSEEKVAVIQTKKEIQTTIETRDISVETLNRFPKVQDLITPKGKALRVDMEKEAIEAELKYKDALTNKDIAEKNLKESIQSQSQSIEINPMDIFNQF